MNFFVGLGDDTGHGPDTVDVHFVDGTLTLPDTALAFQGDYERHGQDLLISFEGGTVRVPDYFVAATPYDLYAPNGAVLTGANVVRLAQAGQEPEFAFFHDDSNQSDATPVQATISAEAIGQVDTLSGTVQVIRADGTTATLGEGDLVYQNDVVSTGAGSTTSLVFVDGTIFTLAQNSRMILDDLVFDPDGSENSGVFNLIQGGFVFVAGQVAKTGQMEVNTPTSTIGIRGTTVEVQIVVVDGITEVIVSLLPDWPDGALGVVDIFDLDGNLVATLTDADTSWVISPLEGETRAIPRAEAIQPDSEALLTQTYDVTERAELRVDAGGEYVIFDTVDGDGGDDPDPQAVDPDQDGQAPGPDAPDGDGGPVEEGAPEEGAPVEETLQDDTEEAEGETQEGAPADPGTEGEPQDGAPAEGEAPPEDSIEDATLENDGAAPNAQAPDSGAPDGGDTAPDASQTPGGEDDASNTQGDASPENTQTLNANSADADGAASETSEPAQGSDNSVTPETGSTPADTQGTGADDDASLTVPQDGTSQTVETAQTEASQPAATQTFSDLTDTELAGITNVFEAPTETFTLDTALDVADPGLGLGTETTSSFGSDPGIGETSLVDPFAGSGFEDTSSDTTTEDTSTAPSTQSATSFFEATTETTQFVPTASDVGAGLLEDGEITLDVVAAATDSGGGALTLVAVSVPANGTAQITEAGAVLYTPNPDYAGTETFTYTVQNDQGNTDTGTVTVTVAPVNDAPQTANDAALTPQDTTIAINVLNNDSDVDNDINEVTISLQDAPSNGTVQVVGTQILYAPDAGFAGTDTFSYALSDGAASSAAAGTVTVVVNDPPVASDTTSGLEEDSGTVTVDVLAAVSDTENDAATVASVSDPANGTAVTDGQNVIYTPDPNFEGTDSFTYTVVDANGATSTGTVVVTVDPVNDNPEAQDDTQSTPEDTAITFDVLAGDTDVDGDTVVLQSFTQPSQGTVTQEPSGQLTYTPNADANGPDSFTYTVIDGNGGSDTATVTVNVQPVNDAPTAADVPNAAATEDTPLSIDLAQAVGDTEGDALTFSFSAPAKGTVALDGTNVVYTPNPNENGADSFTYTINDGNGGVATATVTVDITPVNDNPVAADDSVATLEDAAITFDVLPGDSDVDGDTVTLQSFTQPSQGTVTQEPNGQLTYTPNADANGPDSFSYTIIDGNGGTDTATVTIDVQAVNDAPTAADVPNVAATEDNAVSIDLAPLVSDAEGDALTFSFSAPTQGTLVQTGAGVLYTPNPDANGADSFTYTVNDGNGGTATATVSVTVAAVNDAPVAVADDAITSEGLPLNFDPRGNDSDVDGDALQILSVTQPDQGAVVIEGDGTLTYTPPEDFTGTTSFTYVIEDPDGETSSAVVNLTVTPENDPPVAVDDLGIATNEDTAVTIDVVANDTDVDGDALTVSAVSTATNGTVSIAPDGRVVYTPDADFNGADSFTYTVTDGVLTDTGTVTVDVAPVNDAPIAVDESFATGFNAPLTLSVANLVSNDDDGDPELAQTLSIQAVSNAVGGTVAIDGADVIFTPTSGFSGDASFDYTLSDGAGGTDTGTVTVTVAANTPPVAGDDTTSTAEDTPLSLSIEDNDSDADGQQLTYTLGTPQNGAVTFDGETFNYTPNADFNGTDSFTYTVDDGFGGTDTATVTITVSAVNDDPDAVDDTGLVVPFNAPLEIAVADLLANDTDGDPELAQTLTVTAVDNATNGSVVLDAGTITFTPDTGYTGGATFTYDVSDGAGGTATATVFLSVGANTPPVANDDVRTTQEDSSIYISVLSNDTDADGDALSFTTDQPANGTFAFDGEAFLYTPNADFFGEDSFTYTVDDGNGGIDTATVTITVTPVNDNPEANDDTGIDGAFNSPIVIEAADLLSNDTDIDNDPIDLSVINVGAAQNGTVALSGTTITFTPDLNHVGAASFEYGISDGELGSVATVTLNVGAPTGDVISEFETGTEGWTVNNDGTGLQWNQTGGNPDGYIEASDLVQGDYWYWVAPDAYLGDKTAYAGGSLSFDMQAFGDGVVIASSPDLRITGGGLTIATNIGRPSETEFTTFDVTLDDRTNWRITRESGRAATQEEIDQVLADITMIEIRGEYFNNQSIAYLDNVILATAQAPTAPVAADDTATVLEDGSVVIEVLANDTDVNFDSLTVTSTSVPVLGTVQINNDGTITYTANPDANGTDTFTYTVDDGTGLTDTATVTVDITPVNDAPVATDDGGFVTRRDTPIDIAVADLLANDTDVDTAQASLTITSVSNPIGGSVVLNGDTITFTPTADFGEIVTFDYTVSDGEFSDQATALITISTNQAPMAQDDVFTQTGTAVISNVDLFADNGNGIDADLDGDAFTIVSATNSLGESINIDTFASQVVLPSEATTRIRSDGTIDFFPSGFSGVTSEYDALAEGEVQSEVITYVIEDSNGAQSTATVSFQITGVNDAPITFDDQFVVTAGAGASGNVLVKNDVPEFNLFGQADFDPEGDAFEVTAINNVALADADEDPTTAGTQISSNGGQSLLTVFANGDFVYDSGTAFGDLLEGETLFRSFTYTVTDANGASDNGGLVFRIQGVNDDPVAVDDTVSTDEEVALNFDPRIGDTDADGDALTIDSTTLPANGSVVIEADGTLTYTPNANFSGSDSFDYTVVDGNGGTATGTVQVTVNPINDPPVAVDDAITTNEDTAVTFDFLENDSDVDGNTLIPTNIDTPSNGTLVANDDDTYTYTPDLDFAGTDSFTYTIADGAGGSDTATVTITVTAVEDAPIALDDDFATTENAQVVGNIFADNGNGADFDPDGTGFTLVSAANSSGGSLRIDGLTVILPTGATFNLNGAGDFTYNPGGFGNTTTALEALGDGETFDDGFTYVIQDPTGLQSTGTVTFSVTGENDPPVVALDQYTPSEDDTASGNFLSDATTGSADFDPEGDAFSVTAINGVLLADADQDPVTAGTQITVGDGGQLTVFADGQFTFDTAGAYEQLGNASGQLVSRLQTVGYTVTDENGASSDGTLRFFIQGLNDAPVAVDDSTSTPFGSSVNIDIVANDTDAESDSLAETIVSGPTNGSLIAESDGTYTYTPDPGFSGTDTFTYTVSDGNLTSNTATVSIDVGPAPQGGTVNVTVAGSYTNYINPSQPFDLNGSDMPGEAIYDTSGATPIVRTPTTSTATEIRFTADNGNTFAFIGTGLDFSTGAGLVTSVQIGTPADPDFYDATGLTISFADALQAIQDGIQGSTVTDVPFLALFAPYQVVYQGTDGADWLDFDNGSALNDVYNLAGGDDEIDSALGDDTINAGAGEDFIYDVLGNNVIDGGADLDEMSYQNASGAVVVDINAGTGNKSDGSQDSLTNIEFVTGSLFNDQIQLGDTGQTNVARGLAGADTLTGGAGTGDFVGYDRDSRFTANTTGVVINLALGIATDLFGDQDILSGFEGAIGTEFGDQMVGSDTGIFFFAGLGDDTVIGGLGDDVFFLDGGADVLTYSQGDDFVADFDLDGNVRDELLFSGFALENFGSLSIVSYGDPTTDNFGVILSFTDGATEVHTLTLDLVTEEAINDYLGFPQFFGTLGDDVIEVPTVADDALQLYASPGNDTYIFTNTAERAYQELRYDELGLTTGITANLDVTQTNSTVDKGNGETDTLVDVAEVADWAFAIAGTENNDTFNLTYDANDFAWLGVYHTGGDDVINITGGNGTLRLEADQEGGDTTVDLLAGTLTTQTGSVAINEVSGDFSNFRYQIGTFNGNDQVFGTNNNDLVFLGAGTDSADGRGGDDDVIRYSRNGVEGGVTVNLETGTASGTWDGLPFLHTLTSFEQVRGSAGDDDITATNASSSDLRGNDGDDTLRGGDQQDDLRGGAGDDLLDASGGTAGTQGFGDWIEPGTGSNTILGHQEDWQNGGGIDINYDNVDGTGGLVVTLGPNGAGTVVANTTDGSGVPIVNDTFTFANWLRGTDENDRLVGTDAYSGIDRSFNLRGGAGDDTLIGGGGRENLNGDDGNDLIDASAGDLEFQPNGDYVAPGLGQDTVIGSAAHWAQGEGLDLGYDNVNGTGGLVFAIGANGSGTVVSNTPGAVNDTFTFTNFFLGSMENDQFTNTQTEDRFFGIRPLGGNDDIQGSVGTVDLISYRSSEDYDGFQGGITVNAITQIINDPFGGTDTFSNVEEFEGTDSADQFIGSDTSERFEGEGGNDSVSGGGGNDQYFLGEGADELTFSAGFDYVDDFNVTEDTLILSGLAQSQVGTLDIGQFDDGTGFSLNFDDDFDDSIQADLRLSMGGGITIEDVYSILDTMTFTPVNTSGTSERDVLFGSPENDTINPGSNPGTGDRLQASAGDDVYTFSGATSDSFYDIFYNRLGPVGLTADINLNTTNSTVDKGVAGQDTLVDVFAAAVTGDGFSIFDSDGDDNYTFTQHATDSSWMAFGHERGDDIVTLVGGFGTFRISTAFNGGDVNADLSTGFITDAAGNSIQFNLQGDTSNINRLEIRTQNGNDNVTGNALDNRFILGAGNDFADGGDGFDGLRYDRGGVNDGVVASLASGTATGIWDGQEFNHTFINMEYLRGSNNDDLLIANDAGSELDGRNGNDFLLGGLGDDNLDGDGGDNALIGNGGNDVFNVQDGTNSIVFSSGNAFVDGFDLVNDEVFFDGDAQTFINSASIFDTSGSFGQQVRIEFDDGQGNFFGIDFAGLTVADATTILADATASPTSIQIGTEGGDFLGGSANDDYINVLSNTGQGDIVGGSDGDDEIDFRYASPQGWYGIDYGGSSAISVTSNIDFNQVENTVDKGAAGIDDIVGAFQAAKGFFFILGTSGNDIHNITGHATDETYTEFGHEFQEGQDVVNYAATQGSVRLKMNGSENTVADFSALDIGGAATVTETSGDSLTLNVTGSLDQTDVNVWLGDGDDSFVGNNGNNQVILGAGTDTADGRDGFDTLRYNRSEITEGVTVNMQTGTATGTSDGQAFSHSFSNFERVRGSDFDDDITAGNGVGHRIEGRGGDDLLRRADFNDGFTEGDQGRDTLLQTQSGSFDFSAINVNDSYQDIEVLSLENNGADTATLSLQNVIDFSSTADALLEAAFGNAASDSMSILGEAGDVVRFADGTVAQNGTVQDTDGRTLNVYEFTSGAEILAIVAVDQDVTVETPAI